MPQTASQIQLKPQALKAFDAHIAQAEAAMQPGLEGRGSFLWADADPERARQILRGQIVAQSGAPSSLVKVPEGLIHDWVGAAFVPGATIAATLKVIQDYDNHKNVYSPEVVASKLLSRRGDDFEIYLRLLKKKIITVVLDTDHRVRYGSLDDTRCYCRSYTTRVAEVENPGTARETILEPDTGYGFLWRLHSFWRFQQRDGGVYVECRAISLTRDVPSGLGWIIHPIVCTLPKESLVRTLKCTQQAIKV
jgi:hypothetical protein